jgi:hypothetical protein
MILIVFRPPFVARTTKYGLHLEKMVDIGFIIFCSLQENKKESKSTWRIGDIIFAERDSRFWARFDYLESRECWKYKRVGYLTKIW